MDILASQFRVVSQLAVLPTCKPFSGANPKTPIPGSEHASYIGAREMLARGRLPGDALNAIEAKQAEFRAEPKVTVRCLSNRVDDGFEKAVANGPCVVSVLIDVERRV